MVLTLTLIGAILGAAFSIGTTLLIEYFRIPKLSIVIRGDTPIRKYPKDKPAQKAKFVQAQLWNKPPNKVHRQINKLRLLAVLCG